MAEIGKPVGASFPAAVDTAVPFVDDRTQRERERDEFNEATTAYARNPTKATYAAYLHTLDRELSEAPLLERMLLRLQETSSSSAEMTYSVMRIMIYFALAMPDLAKQSVTEMFDVTEEEYQSAIEGMRAFVADDAALYAETHPEGDAA